MLQGDFILLLEPPSTQPALLQSLHSVPCLLASLRLDAEDRSGTADTILPPLAGAAGATTSQHSPHKPLVRPVQVADMNDIVADFTLTKAVADASPPDITPLLHAHFLQVLLQAATTSHL